MQNRMSKVRVKNNDIHDIHINPNPNPYLLEIPNTTGVDLRRKLCFSPIFPPTFTATFSISWAKRCLDGSQKQQNGMETIWGEAGEEETF